MQKIVVTILSATGKEVEREEHWVGSYPSAVLITELMAYVERQSRWHEFGRRGATVPNTTKLKTGGRRDRL